MVPGLLVDFWIGLDVTLEVDVVAFFDVVWVERSTHF
jgi:hypothetical protein